MDIVTIVISIMILIFMLVGVPLPYIGIGKKIKKGWKLTYGIISFAKERLFVNDEIVERFTWFLEEFENYVDPAYTPSFASMYMEVQDKAKLSKIESEHVSEEIRNVQDKYHNIQDTKNLCRKGIFRDSMKDFKKLVIDVTKMVRRMLEMINENKLLSSELRKDFLARYKFTATQFNDYLASFRRFLDRTYCFHSIEIKHNRLMRLLIPEEIEFPKEVRERL